MRKAIFGLAVAAMLAVPGVMWAEDAPAAPAATAPAAAAPKELTDTIAKAITLLEADKVKETIELLAPPEAYKDGIDKVVTEFAPHKAELLKALKAAQKATPTVTDDKVTYPKSGDDTPALEFSKVKDHWYLN